MNKVVLILFLSWMSLLGYSKEGEVSSGPKMCIPADTRSPIPVIPVHSVGNLQYMWQS